MKTLEDHVILYDADCPLCRAYTGAFVRFGMLGRQGRAAFQTTTAADVPGVDLQRARDEIALFDRRSHEVSYGLDSLFRILGHSWPALRTLFRWRPLYWFLKKLYFFISYNRKVIVAVKPAPGARRSCDPAFNLKYRLLYLLFTWLVVSLVLTRYSGLMFPAGNFGREFLVCGGQLVFQGLVLLVLQRDKLMTYLGHMMTVSAMGALLLLPVLWLSALFPKAAGAYAAYFLGVAAFMLYEHVRRMGLLGLGPVPSLSWVLYRVLVLLLIVLS